jgi:hypothetical protein
VNRCPCIDETTGEPIEVKAREVARYLESLGVSVIDAENHGGRMGICYVRGGVRSAALIRDDGSGIEALAGRLFPALGVVQ